MTKTFGARFRFLGILAGGVLLFILAHQTSQAQPPSGIRDTAVRNIWRCPSVTSVLNGSMSKIFDFSDGKSTYFNEETVWEEVEIGIVAETTGTIVKGSGVTCRYTKPLEGRPKNYRHMFEVSLSPDLVGGINLDWEGSQMWEKHWRTHTIGSEFHCKESRSQCRFYVFEVE